MAQTGFLDLHVNPIYNQLMAVQVNATFPVFISCQRRWLEIRRKPVERRRWRNVLLLSYLGGDKRQMLHRFHVDSEPESAAPAG